MNNNNYYYKKYIKYKNKYQQLKLKISLIKYGGVNKKIYDFEEIIKKENIINLNHFVIDCVEEGYKFIRDKIDSTIINFDPNDLYFVKNNNDNIIGIIPFLKNGIPLKLSTSIQYYIARIMNNFTSTCLSVEEREKMLMNRLLDSVADVNDPGIIINYIIENFKTPDEAYNFIISFINNNDPPGNKTIMYYAVRKGNIILLEFILNYIGETYFRRLMELKDDEGRTLFMISTHSLANQNQIFDIILCYSSTVLLHHRDKFERTALDWYYLRNINNSYILDKLNKIFSS